MITALCPTSPNLVPPLTSPPLPPTVSLLLQPHRTPSLSPIQVEFASVIVINKCDLVSPEHLQRVRAVVRALNGEAKVGTRTIKFRHSAVLSYTAL
jgi:G3E family GTPase